MAMSTGIQTLSFFLVALSAGAHLSTAEVRCFDCPGVSSPHDCTKIKRCRDDQQCFTRAYVNDAYAIRYDMGCQSNGFCSVVPKRSFAQDKEILDLTYAQLELIKASNGTYIHTIATADESSERVEELSHHRQKRQYEIPLCTKCCDQDHCNSDLCPSSLITKPTGLRCYDCGFALVNDPAMCLNIRYCGAGESCHVASQSVFTGIKYQVNCYSTDSCRGSSTPFGKREIVDSEKEEIFVTDPEKISKRDMIDPASDEPEKISKREMIDPASDEPEKISKRDKIDPASDESVKISKREIIDPNTEEIQKISKRAATRCFTCCDTDLCNIDYCSRSRPLPGNMSTPITTAAPTSASTVGTTDNPRLSLLFVQFPEDVDRELNTAPVRWICQVDGLPAPTYKWKVLPADKDITSMASLSADGKTSTLIFDPVTVVDEGEYVCEASNQYESLKRSGKLSVWAPLQDTDPELKAVTEVEEGTNVTLNCEHTGYPTPQYTWEISLLSGMNLTSDLTQYVLANASRDDSGTYECFVANSKENRTLKTTVDVQYAPVFTSQLPASINVTEGTNFTFQCPAEGNPPPIWTFMYFDEDNFPHILSNVFTTKNSDALIIPKMLDSYSGSYTCYIKNSVGTRSQTVTVKVVP